jgi:hypothetical protein
LVHRALRHEGWLAFFENNPWNIGARLVMRRIPFDREAQMISVLRAREALGQAGFRVTAVRSLFYFPAVLKWMRWLEPALAHVPLGAQYFVLCRKID